MSSRWQAAIGVAVCASAGVFVAGALWQMVVPLVPVFGLFFGGWLVSCMLEPVVAWLEARAHVRRPLAVIGTFGAVMFALVLAWLALAPTLGTQLRDGVTNLPGLADAASRRAMEAQAALAATLAQRGIVLSPNLTSPLSLDGIAQRASAAIEQSALSSLTVLGGVAGAFGAAAMVLLLSVFFLLGGRQLADQVALAAGESAAPDVRFVLTTVHDAFGAFIRAQLVQGALFAIGVWACLAIAQVAGAPVVAVSSGVLLLVPVIGAALAVLVPLAATLAWHPDAWLLVVAATVVLEQVVLNVVGPRLMSRSLGLPPLLILFGVLGGAQIGGVWGAVFGVPFLASALTCAGHFRHRFRPVGSDSVATTDGQTVRR